MSRATEASYMMAPPSSSEPDGSKTSRANDASVTTTAETISSPKTGGGDKATSSPSNQQPMNSYMWVASFLWSCFGGVCTVVLPFLFQSLVGGLGFMKYVLVESANNQRHSSPALNNLLHPFDSLQPKTNFPDLASTLTCLALFLCVALAVHPDGFTWQALRKVREFTMTLLNSSSTCWAWLLNDDTGIIASIFAIATFCALFFFCYVLHRTLAPKQPHRNAKSEAMHNSSDGSTCSSLTNSSAVNSFASSSSKRKKKKKKSAKNRNQTSTVNSSTDSGTDEMEKSAPQLSHEQSTTKSVNEVDDPIDSLYNKPEKVKVTPQAPISLENAPARVRMESTSSADTAASSLFLDEDGSTAFSKQANTNNLNISHASKSNHSRNQRPVKQRNPRGNGRGKNSRDRPDLVVSSRWDALKPDAQTSRAHSHRKGPNKRSVNPSNSDPNHRGNKATHNNAVQPPMFHVQKDSAVSVSEPSSVASTPSRKQTRSSRDHEGPHLTTPPVQPTSPSFFSELSAESPSFAPLNEPSGNIRPPPGLSFPTDKAVDPTPFFLPSAYQPSPAAAFGGASMGFPGVSSSLAPPPGLGTSGSATIPAGEDYHASSSLPFRLSSSKVKENPFEDRESEAQIEAELQELGGAMIDNILD